MRASPRQASGGDTARLAANAITTPPMAITRPMLFRKVRGSIRRSDQPLPRESAWPQWQSRPGRSRERLRERPTCRPDTLWTRGRNVRPCESASLSAGYLNGSANPTNNTQAENGRQAICGLSVRVAVSLGTDELAHTGQSRALASREPDQAHAVDMRLRHGWMQPNRFLPPA